MNARFLAIRQSARITRQIGIRWGERFPFYYVSEFPKSGGTWLARMIADYLQLPMPVESLLPLSFSCVVHNMWRYHPRLRRVCYLYRDGRDVMTSLYYDRLRVARHSEKAGRRLVARVYERLFGPGYDPDDIVRHMPRFIEHEFAHPGLGSSVNWRDHVEGWLEPADPAPVSLSYEQLREDCVDTLGRALEALTGQQVDPWRLDTSVEKMSMQRQTGRRPGQSDPTQHIRKGVVGDWRNCFSREAAELFDALAGDTLVRLGYEPDRRWVDRYEYPSP